MKPVASCLTEGLIRSGGRSLRLVSRCRNRLAVGLLASFLSPVIALAENIYWVGDQTSFPSADHRGSYNHGINWLNFLIPGRTFQNGLNAETPGDAVFDSATDHRQNSPGGPPPGGYAHPNYLHFGDFLYNAVLGNDAFVAGRTATPDNVRVLSGSWTFDFGSSTPSGATGNLQTSGFGVGTNQTKPGSASLVVVGPGTLSTAGATIGLRFTSSSGEITVRGADTLWHMTTPGRQDLSVHRGTVRVTDGGTIQGDSGSNIVGRGAGASASMMIDHGGRFVTGGKGEFLIGFESGNGDLVVSSGGEITNTSNTGIGVLAGSVGSASVTGPTTRWSNERNVSVGNIGQGRLTIADRALLQVKNDGVYVGVNGGTGFLEVTSGGQLYANNRLNVGSGGTASVSSSSRSYVGPGAPELLAGTLRVDQGGVVDLSGRGRMRVGNGSLPTTPSTLRIGSGGRLTGNGRVLGNIFIDGGRVSPGSSPGILEIGGDFTLDSTGILEFEIGGLAAGIEYDQLVVSGALTLGGTLEFTFLDAFQPSPGDQFAFFNYGGEFHMTDLNIVAPGGFEFSSSTTNGVVSFTVTQVPEPCTFGLLLLGLLGSLARRPRVGLRTSAD